MSSKRIEELELERKELEKIKKWIPNIDSKKDVLGVTKDGIVNKKSFLFYIMAPLAGHLLSNNPDEVLSERSIHFRENVIHKIILKFNKAFLNGKKLTIVKSSPIPNDRPIIFAPNHGFVEDAISSITVSEKPAYFMFGSLPQFFNTFNGIGAYANGCILVNRKDRQSKKASVQKAIKLLKGGHNLILYPEGVFNKTPNQILLPFWPGIYDIAKESNALIVPIVHLKVGDQIYSKRLDAIDIQDTKQLDRKEFVSQLREKMGSEIYEMMLEYTPLENARNNIMGKHDTMHDACEQIVEQQVTSAGKYYDYEIETTADFQIYDNIKPWEDIADINDFNASNYGVIQYAKEQVKQYKKENYQRKY